jgi:hypothetical protein
MMSLPSKGRRSFVCPPKRDDDFQLPKVTSASGSITKSRNVETQAVFSLRGKPLNSFGLTKKVVYENEEFNLLQHALNDLKRAWKDFDSTTLWLPRMRMWMECISAAC